MTPNDIAATFSHVLKRLVRAEAVGRDSWERLFREQGMKHPEPRMRMLDGFNEGWIDFSGSPGSIAKGNVDLKTVLRELVDSFREAQTNAGQADWKND